MCFSDTFLRGIGVIVCMFLAASGYADCCLDTQYAMKLNEKKVSLGGAMYSISQVTGLQICGYLSGDGWKEEREMHLEDCTGRYALDWLMSQWPEYECIEGPGNTVAVIPIGSMNDPEFVLNIQTTSQEYVDVSMSHVSSYFMGRTYDSPKKVKFYNPDSGLGGKQKVIDQMTVTGTIPACSLLDYMMYSCDMAGEGVSWIVVGSGMNVYVTDIPKTIVTMEMAKADEYAIGSNRNPVEMCRLYDEALIKAPLDAVRQTIKLKKAEAILKLNEPTPALKAEAKKLFREVYDAYQPEMRSISSRALEGYVFCCLQDGDSREAITLLEKLSEMDFQGLHRIGLSPNLIVNSWASLNYAQTDTYECLADLETRYKGRPGYDEALKTKREEIGMRRYGTLTTIEG